MDVFLARLRAALATEQELAERILPELVERIRSAVLRRAAERHLLETEEHVRNLRRVLAVLDEPAAVEDGEREPTDLDHADALARIEHLELAAYGRLVGLALALELPGEVVHLLRLNMEQDAHALEQVEHAAAQLLAEKTPA